MCFFLCCFFYKQKTAYEMRISDWSSDVCSSDLRDMLKDENPHRPLVQRTASEAHRTAPKSLEPGQNLVRGRQVLVRDGIRTHAGRVPAEHLVYLLPELQPHLGSTPPDRSPIVRGPLQEHVHITPHIIHVIRVARAEIKNGRG